MDHNPEECPVCWIPFDDTEQRPRTLPCGHTLCTFCIDELVARGQIKCPTCRIKHRVPKTGHFPICYTLEAVIKTLRNGSTSSTIGSRAPRAGQNGEGSLTRRMCSLLQEQEAKVLAAISTCQEVQAQLDQYKGTLSGWHDRQEQLEYRLQAVVDTVKNARLLVQQEEYQVTVKKIQVQQEEQQLHALLEPLSKIRTVQEACKVINDVDQCINKAEQGMEACLQGFPDMNTVTAVRKVRDASREAMEAIHTVQTSLHKDGSTGAAGNPSILEDSDSAITDRLQALLTPTVRAEDLFSLRHPARRLLEAGLVVTVHQVEGHHRYARISLETDQLYLHSMQDQPPPLGAAILQMDEVVSPSLPCVAFLDLAWPGSAPRRVLVHLSRDTPRGRQFVMLCTGQRGPSYASTRLWGVSNKGLPGEWVWGGDYNNNNGKGGAALLPDLDEGQYHRSGRAGDVWGVWGGGADRGAQFCINTRERSDGYLFYGVYGEVVSGLDIVKAAAHHSDITEVTVVDCGVVWS